MTEGRTGTGTYDAQATGIGNGGGEFSIANPLHPALDYGDCDGLVEGLRFGIIKRERTFDAKGAGQLGVERHLWLSSGYPTAA